jgi:hypothetical protein
LLCTPRQNSEREATNGRGVGEKYKCSGCADSTAKTCPVIQVITAPAPPSPSLHTATIQQSSALFLLCQQGNCILFEHLHP